MRITIVIGAFLPLPPGPCGAVERLWHDLGREFAARGHEVTFVARAYPGQQPDERAGSIRYIRRSGYSRTGRTYLNLSKDLLYSLRMLPVLPRSDIVVMNVFWLPVLTSILRPGAGKVVISVNRMPKGQMGLYRKCARLAACSNAIRDEIAAQRPDVLPITRVLPNPVNTELFRPPAGGRDYSGPRTILYTGRVHPEKGLHILIDAFARLHRSNANLTLRIVGPTRAELGGAGEPYMQQLRQKSRGLPVEFADPIFAPQRLVETLQQAHYYCYPTLADMGEALPVAPIEAMATGLAPVVSRLACFRDYIEDGVSGFAYDHHADDPVGNLASVLAKLIADPQLTMRMGENAARRALEFSTQAVAGQYLADFEELLRTPTPALEVA